MTRFALILVLLLSLTACGGAPSDRDLTATPLLVSNETVVAHIAETNTASADFGLTQSAATLVSTSTATTPPTQSPLMFISQCK